MKKSLRSISNALLGVGVALVFMGVFMTAVGNCTAGNCFSATVLFGLPASQSVPTDPVLLIETALSTQVASTKAGTFTFVHQIIEDLGMSLIFVAVLGIIVLELIELHYIRQFFRQKKTVR